MPSNRQLKMKGDDVKRNVLERKDLSQQVKLFQISKNIPPCREGPCPSLGGHGQPAPPLRSWEAADESGLMGWRSSLWGALKLLGSGLFGGNIFCFPQKQPSPAKSSPLWGWALEAAWWDAVWVRGPPSTASALSPAMSQPPTHTPKRPTAPMLGPKFQSGRYKSSPFSLILT